MFRNPFARAAEPSGGIEFLIVGLGNPGAQYEGTRHNAGFFALEKAAAQAGARVDRLKFKGLCGAGAIAGKKVLFLKPSTFMNLSGQSVQEAMAFYKLPPERVIILFDDISLPPGKLRIRRGGSDGGHNGMKNILYLTGSDQFPRIKLGVGAKPDPQWSLADWVLSRMSQAEQELLDSAAQAACEALECMVSGKIEEAMNRFNGRGDGKQA